jgi:hypothetical protein
MAFQNHFVGDNNFSFSSAQQWIVVSVSVSVSIHI